MTEAWYNLLLYHRWVKEGSALYPGNCFTEDPISSTSSLSAYTSLTFNIQQLFSLGDELCQYLFSSKKYSARQLLTPLLKCETFHHRPQYDPMLLMVGDGKTKEVDWRVSISMQILQGAQSSLILARCIYSSSSFSTYACGVIMIYFEHATVAMNRELFSNCICISL